MANIEYKCPNCNGSLVLDPKTNKLVCEFCDSAFNANEISGDTDAQEIQHSAAEITEEFLNGETAEVYWQKIAADTKGYLCPSCGGGIIGTEVSSSLFCPYCGNSAVIESNLVGEFKPDYIIPFKKTKDDAIAAFKKFCGKGFFLPKKFNVHAAVEKVTGIYVPYHLYSCFVTGNATFKCEEITRWSDSNYDYKKVDTYISKRAGSMAFKNVPMGASKSIDNAFMESIEPYNYSMLQPFDMAFLSGFLSDKYDVKPEECENHLKDRVVNTLQNNLRNTVTGYDSVIRTAGSSEIKSRTFSYALLPVWLLRLKSGNEYYYFSMNGQTGKAAGRLPVSGAKVFFTTAGISLGGGILAFIISQALWAGLLVAAVLATIFGITFGKSYKNVSTRKEADYYISKELVLSHKSDNFTGTHTEKTRRSNNNNR